MRALLRLALLTTLLPIAVFAEVPRPDRVVSGRLDGPIASWGGLVLQAWRSRDFSAGPIAESPVSSTGAFALALPADVPQVLLALWPERGAAVPILLRELPVRIEATTELVVPIPAPPARRDTRHALGSPAGMAFGLGAALLAVLVVVVVRRRTDSEAVAPLGVWPSTPSGGRPLGVLLAALAGLLGYGLLALDESMDLLEYTYFQEGFAGDDPLTVAFSPIVAERAHAPGYAVLVWLLRLISRAPAWLRLPAVLAALAGAALAYRHVATVLQSRGAGLLAALLVGLSPLAMRYGRDLTPYSVIGLLAVASTWSLHRALDTGHQRSWLAFVSMAVLAFFLHYFSAFFTVGQAVAVVWHLARTSPGTARRRRIRDAVTAFGLAAVPPLLWAGQVVVAFQVSADDNLVTHAVYPEAPSFAVYLARHLRVLFGLPPGLEWLVAPVLLLVGFGGARLFRDSPVLARLLLGPLLLGVGLLVLTYALHAWAYGGRVYYGWRWLRPYPFAIATLLAACAFRPIGGRLGSALCRLAVAGLVVASASASIVSATTRERPATDRATELLRGELRDDDAIGVLPAPFYAVGLGYSLYHGAVDDARGQWRRFVHPGPSGWEHLEVTPGSGDFKRVFAPLRGFGLPLESLAGHVDIGRLWVVRYREILFGQPEFDEAIPDAVVAALDHQLGPHRAWRLPHLDVLRWDGPPVDPWSHGAPVRVDLRRPYRSLRVLREALDPDTLFEAIRGDRALTIRLPLHPSARVHRVHVEGLRDAASVRVNGTVMAPDTRLDVPIDALGFVEVAVERTPPALQWPLTVVVTAVP